MKRAASGMEMVIPPRDHGGSVYRYAWDDDGQVISAQRVAERLAQEGLLGGGGRDRQTIQWPYQSIAEESILSSPTIMPIPFRRATLPPPRLVDDNESIFAPLDRDLVPDYVLNFMNGETPESIAWRQRHGERGPSARQKPAAALPPPPRRGHRHRPSRVVEFEAFVDPESIRSSVASTSASSVPGSDEEMLPGGSSEKPSGRRSRRLTDGWRGGVAVNVLLSFLIMVVGFVGLTLVVSRAQMFSGESLLYTGSCATTAHLDWGFHGLIAIMATALIAGANYVFQVLSAPTRAELAAAHDARRWVDLGIPSVRNFAHISAGRVVLSIAILGAAVLTQVIYHSILFTTQTGVGYSLLLVGPSFLSGAPFSNATSNNAGGLDRFDILNFQQRAIRGGLVSLSSTDCLQEFGGAFATGAYDAVLVVTNFESPGSSLVQTGLPGSRLSQFRISGGGRSALLADSSSVSSCLASPATSEPQCSLSVNASLLVVVAFLNLITVICTAGVLTRSAAFRPLVTLGDALASFLRDPDPTTRDACLLSKQDVWQGRWGFREAKYFVPRTYRWFATPSLPRWLFASFLWWSLVGLVCAALGVALHNAPTGRSGAFGVASPHSLLILPASAPAGAVALAAALPHILLAALYFAANGLLSTMFLSHELSLFAAPGGPRPLRVSAAPEGQQRTSLFITLPRPWSWALLVLFAAAAFALRQSLVFVAVALPATAATATAPAAPARALRALGFAPAGLALLLALLAALAALVLGLGARSAPPASAGAMNGTREGPRGNPLVLPAGSCSAVLAARCQRGAGAGEPEPRLWARELRWGITGVSPATGVAHCTFSARGVGEVDLARCYA